MKKSTTFLSLLSVLFSVLVILFLENFFKGFFIAPFIECVVVFLDIWFVMYISEDSLFGITILTAFLFFCFETIVYLISAELGFINNSLYEVFSWRVVYGLFFTFIWIPITVFGLRYKEKGLWFLFLFLGCMVHLIINLIMVNF